METLKTFLVAGHPFAITGKELCRAVEQIEGFKPFEIPATDPFFVFCEDTSIPLIKDRLHTFCYEDVTGDFCRTTDGYLLTLQPSHEPPLYLWIRQGQTQVSMCGNFSIRLSRFALWIGFGLMTLSKQTLAIHSSCLVYNKKAILFLGESGTGKSTHTALWRKHIDGTTLLNDDSPMLRIKDGKLFAYGSPWSGKTPCYKNECYEIAACVRLSQAPYNKIELLPVLQAYGAIHPSCAPSFAYCDELYDTISEILGQVISTIPIFHLACLPDREAAELACHTLFQTSSMLHTD